MYECISVESVGDQRLEIRCGCPSTCTDPPGLNTNVCNLQDLYIPKYLISCTGSGIFAYVHVYACI